MDNRGVLSNRARWIISIILVIIIVLIGVYSYSGYKNYNKCETFECFKSGMESCEGVSFLSDQKEASWLYEVQGLNGNNCDVGVTLLQAKSGEIGIDKLVGEQMTCSFAPGVADYPEKDLKLCHGRLKEDMQTIIINKLYSYVISNIGEMNDSLRSAV